MITALQRVAAQNKVCINQDLRILYQLRNNATWLRYMLHAARDPSLLWNLSEFFSKITLSWLVTLARLNMPFNKTNTAISIWVARNLEDFEIKCVTAAEMSSELRAKLESGLKAKYARNKVRYEIDENIHGGIQLIFTKYIIDNSLKTKFQRFQAECRQANILKFKENTVK